MGGTTAKCAMIERGRYAVELIYHIGGPDAGFPIRGNVIDILEVGVGGGSIAWLDDQRRLNVGPRSAGSTPGPACYGRGGTEPTVTDANLMLGRLDPENFLGGEMRLKADAGREALRGTIAEPLGYGGDDAVTRAAKGVLTIANLTMSSIIKKVSIARGYDPRDFALFCYGGGGPLHGVELARALNIPRVIVPPEPGNFSAIGMLLADPRIDTAQTFVVRLNPENLSKAVCDIRRPRGAGPRRAAARIRRRNGYDRSRSRDALQGPTPLHQDRRSTKPTRRQRLRARFDDEYLRRYGHANAAAEVELVVLHSFATMQMRRPDIARLARPRSRQAAARTRSPADLLPGGGTVPADANLRSLRARAGRSAAGAGDHRRIRVEHLDRPT